MGDTSLPLLLSEKVKRDPTDKSRCWYFLRLTPENDNYKLDDVLAFVKNLTLDDVWFVSEELSKKGVKHFHCIIWVSAILDPREEIKEWLISKFPGAWKKQDGNKRYNLQQVNDLTQCFKYTSKDGDFFYGSGVNKEYIMYVNSSSFQKKDTRIGQLLEARSAYIRGDITDYKLFESAIEVCIATSATGSVNSTYIKSFMLGARCEKDPDYKKKFYDSINF